MKIFHDGTPSENDVYDPMKPHANFGAFIRQVTLMGKFDVKPPNYYALPTITLIGLSPSGEIVSRVWPLLRQFLGASNESSVSSGEQK